MIHFLTRKPSGEYVWDYVRRIQDGGGPEADVLFFEDVLEARHLPRGIYVFTGLNRMGPATTGALGELWGFIRESTGFAPLNHPARALRRIELLEALELAGINRFSARGAWEDLSGLKYPLFVRDRSQHGDLPSLLHSRRDVERAIGWKLVRGADLSELIVVEFLDTSEKDGYFRKFSAYIVGETVIPVSMERGKGWVLRHPAAEFTPEALEEEKQFVLDDPHQDQLQEVRRISRIEFGRIDYSVLEGKVQIWEINTLPTMRRPPGCPPFPEHLRPLRETKREMFKARFKEAWAALPAPDPDGPPVEPGLAPELSRAALDELSRSTPATFPDERRYGRLKWLLRPVKPILMPLAGKTVVPLFARRAMRRTPS